MLKRKCFTLYPVCFLFVLLFAFMAVESFANSIGFSYGSGFGDMNLGMTGDYEADWFEIEGTAQAGDVIDAKIEPAIMTNIFGISGRLFSVNSFKGESLDTLGRTLDVGADLVFPLTGDIDGSIGIFGRNGNPFSTTYELVDPTNPDAGVQVLNRGIPIRRGSSVNAAVAAEFDISLISEFEVELRGLLQLRGDDTPEAGEVDIAHQFIVDISTDGQFSGNLGWNVALEIEIQRYQLTDEDLWHMQDESSIYATLTYDF